MKAEHQSMLLLNIIMSIDSSLTESILYITLILLLFPYNINT